MPRFKINSPIEKRVIDATYKRNAYHFPKDMTGMIVVDVGAHIGTATYLCASRGATVYAFEPDLANFDLLRFNTRKLSNIFYYQWAVGNTGMRKFFHNPNNTASNILYGLPNSVKVPNPTFVSTFSLKEIFEKMEIKNCDYLKLDCEGAEIELIDDIVTLRDKIKTIVGELHFRNIEEIYKSKLSDYYEVESLQGYEWRFIKR